MCDECTSRLRQEGQNAYAQPQYNQPLYNSAPLYIPDGTYSSGIGKALASTIMSGVAFIIAYVCMLGYSLSLFYDEISWIWYFLSIGLAVPSIVLGILSISHFKRCSRANCKKPVATLVLGINGLVCAIGAIVMALLAIMLGEIFDYLDYSYYDYYYYY